VGILLFEKRMEDSSFNNPFYLELTRYPSRFARAVYLGEPPPFSPSTYMASATMTLLRFDNLFIGVTCHHVLARYREVQATLPDIFCQIGQVRFNPLEYLIDEDKERDLATFNLTSFVGKVEGLDEAQFIEPPSWPPGNVSEEDIICLAGYPGIWREQLSLGELRFYSFSSGATFVKSAGEERFGVRLQSEGCIVTINKEKILGDLGGMSGGPVFCWRRSGVFRAELVGFIYEYQETWDIMLVRAAKVLNPDGTFI
jgi:hypothetical protein